MKKNAFVCYLCSSFFSLSIYAENTPIAYGQMTLKQLLDIPVYVASGTKQTLTKASSTVTVVTEDDIKLTGASNLSDVLESVPGLHIRASIFANRPLIHIRGTNGRQTLLLINGNRIKDLAWTFGIYWKGLPVSMIKRVEIIRGPGSAVYGADATAGVINVITKTADNIEGSELGVSVGSFNTQNTWLAYGNQWQGYDINLTADFFHTDGHEPWIEKDGQSLNDSYNGTTASYAPAKVGYGWKNADIRFSIAKSKWRFMFDFMQQDDVQTGLSGGGVIDPVTQGKSQNMSMDLIFNDQDSYQDTEITANLHLSYLQYNSGDGFQEQPPNSYNGLYPEGVLNHLQVMEKQAGFNISSIYSGISRHRIRLGTGISFEKIVKLEQYTNKGLGPNGELIPVDAGMVNISDTAYAFAPEKSRILFYGFIQDEWQFAEKFQFTAGLRYDHYSDFGSTANPRVSLLWEMKPNLTSKILFARAFRAPSYLELYSVTERANPNASLTAEESTSLELSIRYQPLKDLHMGISLFSLKMDDFIRPVIGDNQTKAQFINTGENEIRGYEVDAIWQLSSVIKLQGNYTYRRPQDNSYRVVSQPSQQAYLRADWTFFPDWNWNIQTHWIAERERADKDSRNNIDNYTLTDTTLYYSGIKNWKFSLSIKNVFDEDAREHTSVSVANDFPLPQRNAYFNMSYQF